jgi:hypothetical protein
MENGLSDFALEALEDQHNFKGLEKRRQDVFLLALLFFSHRRSQGDAG